MLCVAEHGSRRAAGGACSLHIGLPSRCDRRNLSAHLRHWLALQCTVEHLSKLRLHDPFRARESRGDGVGGRDRPREVAARDGVDAQRQWWWCPCGLVLRNKASCFLSSDGQCSGQNLCLLTPTDAEVCKWLSRGKLWQRHTRSRSCEAAGLPVQVQRCVRIAPLEQLRSVGSRLAVAAEKQPRPSRGQRRESDER